MQWLERNSQNSNRFLVPASLKEKLLARAGIGGLRKLKLEFPEIDFCSNDYLGYSKLGHLSRELKQSNIFNEENFGSTGSRLISGNSLFVEQAEEHIAKLHLGAHGLIFNSGYDANLGLLSSVPSRGDLVLYDELSHASIYDGIRLSFSTHYKFKHNNLSDLEGLLNRNQHKFRNIFIVVESVYSMGGDLAPLQEIIEFKNNYPNIYIIVDEAHAIGVFGDKGLGICNLLGIEDECFARIYTYGKAMGCHGACVIGSLELKDYLINFARSFIYSTALPKHSVSAILAGYSLLKEERELIKLQDVISYFKSQSVGIKEINPTNSAIQALILKNNQLVDSFELEMFKRGIYVKAIKSPTVKLGSERIRICLHAFNTQEQVDLLINVTKEFLKESKIL